MGNAISDKKNARRVALKLNNRTDADILAKLDSVDNKQAYVKRLIRADLESGKPKKTVTEVITAPEGKMSSLSLPDGRKVNFNQAIFYDDNSCDLVEVKPRRSISFTVPADVISPEALAIIQGAPEGK